MTHDEKLDPIRQSVHVDCPPEDAFRLFTERFGEWWPGDGESTFEIEPWKTGKIVERTCSGDQRERGTVTTWEPPDRFRFTWSSQADVPWRGDVEVEFAVEAEGTRVTLIHAGWHSAPLELVCFAGFVHETMIAV